MNAVSEDVANQLKAKGLTVNRISGNDRYETALKVAKEAIDNGVLKSNKVFLCSGISPADALSIASAAAKEEGIILLTDGNSLKGAEKYIKSGVEVKIIGGTSVISDKLEQELTVYQIGRIRLFFHCSSHCSLSICCQTLKNFKKRNCN